MKKYTLLILIPLLLQSCITYEISKLFKPSGFSYKYDGENTGLDSLLFMHGYFMTEKDNDVSILTYERYGIDGYYYAKMFYPDGLICSVSSSDSLDIPRAFSENSEIKNWLTWGRYIVSGDTIKIQYIFDTGAMAGGVQTSHSSYKIIGKNKIKEIKDTKSKDKRPEKEYTFYPLLNRLSPANCPWLKKGWFRKKGVEEK